jgi:pyruvate,water dikinase
VNEISLTAMVLPFEQLTMHDVETVGGKNASIGEMIGALSKLGVRVPGGFATTAAAYRQLLAHQGLDTRIRQLLTDLDVDDVVRLAEVGRTIRGWILETPLPSALEQAVREGYRRFGKDAAVAVRSSATAEDLPEASFAGQQETFLNVQGEDAVIEAMSSRHSSTTGRSPTAFTRASITHWSRCRRAFSKWCARISARAA